MCKLNCDLLGLLKKIYLTSEITKVLFAVVTEKVRFKNPEMFKVRLKIQKGSEIQETPKENN